MKPPMPSMAVGDLGIGAGDALKSQLELQEEERKKKLLAQQRAQATLSGSMYGPATQSLFAGGYGLG